MSWTRSEPVPKKGNIDEKELEITRLLQDAWKKFLELEVLHYSDKAAFDQAITTAQTIIWARHGFRLFGEICKERPKDE